MTARSCHRLVARAPKGPPATSRCHPVVIFLLFLALCCSCGNRGSTVILPDQTQVKVEIADTPSKREQGLMFRQDLGANQGMLFVFPSDGQGPFWMRNTYLPLDLIFIDANQQVVDVISNAAPLSDRLLTPKSPYRYVLEVNGGFAASHGIKTGGPVQLP